MPTVFRNNKLTGKTLKSSLHKSVVKFKVSFMRDGEYEDRFGGGEVKKKDLYLVITELLKLARELDMMDAEARGYRQAIEEHEIETENDDYQNDNDQNDNQDDEDEDDE
jgi:hypothetical protein